MYTSFFIARHNMKKKKSDVAIITIMIMLATMLLYISTSVLGNTEKVVDNAGDVCNSADHVYFTSVAGSQLAKEIWDGLDDVKEYEISPVLLIPAAKYSKEQTDEKKPYSFIFSSIGEERNINRINIVEQSTEKDNSIVLPYSMKITEDYKLGDSFYLEVNGHTYEFEVTGFTEDPLFATALNITVNRCYIPEGYMDKISNESDPGKSYQYEECRVKLNEGVDPYAYVDTFVDKLAGRDDDSYIGLVGETMKGGLLMMPNIMMGITMVFSIVLIVIVIIIMRFSVKNFIEENLKNIGILQASGYTSTQLRLANVMETVLIGITGCILGLILSVCGGGVIGNIQASIIGLKYDVGFDMGYGLFAFVLVMAIVLIISCISSRTYKKINVLDALRGGIHTHNFKKNVIPLSKTKLPVNTAIGAKNVLGAKFRNMGIIIIVAILSFASCVGFALYENFAVNKDFMLKLVGAELGTAITAAKADGNAKEMGETIEGFDVVEKVNYYNSLDIIVSCGDKSKTITSDVWKKPEELENIMIVDGQMPVYDNEVVISTIVRDFFDVNVGDVIYLQGESEKLPYIVSGIHQMINNNGEKIMINYDGASRLNPSSGEKTLQLYIYAKEGYGYSDIKKLMDEYYPGIEVAESEEMAAESLSIVTLAMELLCALFVIITIVVVFLVVFLLIRTKVVSDRKNNGIFKALGYTTKNLMVQTTMSNLPVIFTGAVIGAIMSIFGTNPLTKICLSFCGIEKCDMTISPIYLIGTIIVITVVAWAVAMAVASRIRKVEPVKMLTEE